MKLYSSACQTCHGKGYKWTPRAGELRRTRERAGVSLRAMARKMRLSPSYLSDVETGRRNVTDAILHAYDRLAPAGEQGGEGR